MAHFPLEWVEMNSLTQLVALGSLSFALSSCGPEPVASRYGTGYVPGAYGDGGRYGAATVPQGNRVQQDNVSYWDGDNMSGEPGITIDISQQRAYFYKGYQLAGVSLVSTGTSTHPTTLGDYKITEKDIDHESNLYGDYVYSDGSIAKSGVKTTRDKQPPGTRYDGADMKYFMRFNGGEGMHAGYLPGYAASHGCVRMPENMARIFYNNVAVGTRVRVIP